MDSSAWEGMAFPAQNGAIANTGNKIRPAYRSAQRGTARSARIGTPGSRKQRTSIVGHADGAEGSEPKQRRPIRSFGSGRIQGIHALDGFHICRIDGFGVIDGFHCAIRRARPRTVASPVRTEPPHRAVVPTIDRPSVLVHELVEPVGHVVGAPVPPQLRTIHPNDHREQSELGATHAGVSGIHLLDEEVLVAAAFKHCGHPKPSVGLGEAEGDHYQTYVRLSIGSGLFLATEHFGSGTAEATRRLTSLGGTGFAEADRRHPTRRWPLHRGELPPKRDSWQENRRMGRPPSWRRAPKRYQAASLAATNVQNSAPMVTTTAAAGHTYLILIRPSTAAQPDHEGLACASTSPWGRALSSSQRTEVAA